MTAKSPFSRFKHIKPKKISIDHTVLVKERFLAEGLTLPLVLEPEIPDLDAGVWLTSQRDQLIQKLYRHGALLFRGFGVDGVEAFEAFAGAICADLYGEYGDLPHAKGRIYDVTPYPPEGTILFHNESSHMARWPMKQFFFCLQPAAKGGETPIVDCREVYRRLDPALIKRLADKKLKYVRNFIAGVDVSWQDFFKSSNRAEVEAKCRENGVVFQWKNEDDLMTHQLAPAVARHPITGERVFFNQIQLHHIACLEEDLKYALLNLFPHDDLPRNVYFGNGDILEDDVVKAIEQIYWQIAVSFSWQTGDVLLVDNMLVAHARLPYTPPREMFVAMGELTGQPASPRI